MILKVECLKKNTSFLKYFNLVEKFSGFMVTFCSTFEVCLDFFVWKMMKESFFSTFLELRQLLVHGKLLIEGILFVAWKIRFTTHKRANLAGRQIKLRIYYDMTKIIFCGFLCFTFSHKTQLQNQ